MLEGGKSCLSVYWNPVGILIGLHWLKLLGRCVHISMCGACEKLGKKKKEKRTGVAESVQFIQDEIMWRQHLYTNSHTALITSPLSELCPQSQCDGSADV